MLYMEIDNIFLIKFFILIIKDYNNLNYLKAIKKNFYFIQKK